MSRIFSTFLLIISLATAIYPQKLQSVYTDLKTCKEIKTDSEEGVLYQGECWGVGGYKLHLLEGDLRQSLDLIAPSGQKFNLDLWLKVTAPMYSYLGEKVEWRIVKKGKKVTPIAFIVRFNAYEDSSNSQNAKSFLVVIKINPNAVCITDVVKPSKNQNLTARKLADIAGNKPCLAKQL